MLKSGNKKLVGNFLTYGATNSLASGLPLLILPFLTKFLSPEDIALIAVFQLLFNVLNPFVGVNGVALSSVVYYEKTEQDFVKHRNAFFSLILLSSIVIAVLFYAFQNFLIEITAIPLKWLLFIIVYASFEKVAEFLLAHKRLLNKALHFAIWRIARVALEVGLTVYFLLYVNQNWESRALGIATAGIAIGIIALAYYLRKDFSLSTNKGEIKEILNFGLPYIPHVLGGVVLTYMDILFVRNMVGNEATGFYAVGYQIGMIVSLVQNSFNQAWVPWFFAKLKVINDDIRTQLVKITYGYFIALSVFTAVLVVTLPYVFELFFDERYTQAIQYVGWIAAGYAVNGMYKMVVNYLVFLKRTTTIASVTIVVAVLNLVLNYVLIDKFGAIGAAQSTFICFAIQFVVIWVISNKQYPMNWLMR